MPFSLIDYSELYFTEIQKIEIPPKRSGKFIQIQNEAEEQEYLVLSPWQLSEYHANIVERFCLMNGIEGAYRNPKKQYFEIHDPVWTVLGGGVWVINGITKTLTLSGMSQAYGAFDSGGLQEKLSSSPMVSGYTIKIV